MKSPIFLSAVVVFLLHLCYWASGAPQAYYHVSYHAKTDANGDPAYCTAELAEKFRSYPANNTCVTDGLQSFMPLCVWENSAWVAKTFFWDTSKLCSGDPLMAQNSPDFCDVATDNNYYKKYWCDEHVSAASTTITTPVLSIEVFIQDPNCGPGSSSGQYDEFRTEKCLAFPSGGSDFYECFANRTTRSRYFSSSSDCTGTPSDVEDHPINTCTQFYEIRTCYNFVFSDPPAAGPPSIPAPVGAPSLPAPTAEVAAPLAAQQSPVTDGGAPQTKNNIVPTSDSNANAPSGAVQLVPSVSQALFWASGLLAIVIVAL